MIACAIAAALAALPAAFAQAPPGPGDEPLELHVDDRRGDDAGDGSADRPFRSLRRALALHSQAPQRALVIRLGLGHYGVDSGEALPIVLPLRCRIEGFGSYSAEIVGQPELPLFVLPATGELELASVVLRGAQAAISVGASSGTDRADARLVDVAIEGCAIGIDLRAARGAIALRGEGLRVSGAKEGGLLAGGAAALELALERSRISGCGEGIAITTEGAPPDGPSHAVVLRATRFEGNEGAGLVRRGKDGRDRSGGPWVVEDCAFRGGQFGASFEIPGGDVPLLFRRCEFEECDLFGLSIVGSGEARDGASRIEECRFRWNGIGAQILSAGRPVELSGCRFEDSVGNGLFVGNFVGARTAVSARRCILAGNGAAGLFGLCERESGIAVELVQCTVTGNRGSGVERRNRKRGSGPFELVRCIVTGNGSDLARIEPGEVIDCLVGEDARFADPLGRDWRVAADSPARRADGVLGALPDEPPPRGAGSGR